ncbi:CaiF/GrlA family transcriptional regulator [Serratia fonticola]|uniref:CaiF/GrlA family transcriptional regulator n=1 Tax=Serratia fonticola TaxID=47917 RepID=UPI002DBC655F|nr:CaiF/GrlA family transcriptional regulator [Serratia fonticola]MEB7884030.1 CaiF/GrlA family transcriptional regulator [Serratia fonticola]
MATQEHNVGVVVAPGQSNYGEYTLPAMLEGLGDPPLYLAVAIWGWRLGRPFCRGELAQTFRITLQRAGDVMSYIRRADQRKIASRQSYERAMNGARRRYLHIVAEPDMSVKKVAKSKSATEMDAVLAQGVGQPTEAELQALRRWFLIRPNPG